MVRTINRKLLLPAALLIIAVIQAWLALDDYGIRWLKASWRTRGLSSEQRSARFLVGDEGYRFVDFIKSTVPDDSAVVKPDGVGALSQQSNMQFLFLPRRIPACPCGSLSNEVDIKACSLCLNEPGHYVLAIGDYPQPGLLDGTKEFVEFPFDSDTLRGYYSAVGAQTNSTEPYEVPSTRSKTFPLASVIEVFLLIAMWMSGTTLVQRILGQEKNYLSLLVDLPVGMGLSTFILFLLGWLGLPINQVTTGLVIIGLTAAAGITSPGSLFDFSRLKQWLKNAVSLDLPGLVSFIGFLIIATMLITSIIIAIGRSYSTYDGIANWALKGYAIAEFDSIFAGQNWGGHGLSYPQNIHLATSIFRTLTGDVLPGSKLLHPLFFAIIILSVIGFFYKELGDGTLAIATGALVATLPFPYFHSTLGFANIIFSGYLVAGSLLLIRSLEHEFPRQQVLSGLLLGFAAWTRPEGIYFGLALIFVLIASHIVRFHRWGPIFRVTPPFALIASIWQIFGTPYQSRDEIGRVISEFLTNLAAGLLPSEPFQVLTSFSIEHLTSMKLWGFSATIIVASLLLAVLIKTLRNNPLVWNIWLAAAASFFIPLSMFIVSGLARSGFRLFLQVSFDRAMIPGMVTLIAASIFSLGLWVHRSDVPDPSTS